MGAITLLNNGLPMAMNHSVLLSVISCPPEWQEWFQQFTAGKKKALPSKQTDPARWRRDWVQMWLMVIHRHGALCETLRSLRHVLFKTTCFWKDMKTQKKSPFCLSSLLTSPWQQSHQLHWICQISATWKPQENPCSLLPPSFLPSFTPSFSILPSLIMKFPTLYPSLSLWPLSPPCVSRYPAFVSLSLPAWLCLLASSPPTPSSILCLFLVSFASLFHALLPRPCVHHWIKKTHPDIVQHLPLSPWQRPIVEYEDWHAADTHHLSQRYRGLAERKREEGDRKRRAGQAYRKLPRQP